MNPSLGTVLVLVVYVLAVARLTRLVNVDRIAAPLRLWPANRAALADLAAGELEQAGKTTTGEQYRRRARRWDLLDYLLRCPWCVGFWLCLGTAWLPLHFAGNPVVQYVGVALAASHIVGLLAPFAEDEEVEIVADEPRE